MTEKPAITMVLDRFEGGQAVLVADSGQSFTLDRTKLDKSLSEGAVLRVPISPAGAPIWKEARVDSEETEKRLREATRLLRKLRTKKRSPSEG
jgi:hypothetical protein